MPDPLKVVKIDYIKSNYFRVIHADGVFGGINARGLIHMDIWSDRPVIPQQVVHPISDEQGLGPEIKERRKARDADMVREVEAGIVLNVELAKSLIAWLKRQVSAIETIKEGGEVNFDE